MQNILNLTKSEIKDILNLINEKPFRVSQILKWLYIKNVSSFREMSDLSVSLREKLSQIFCISDVTTEEIMESTDKSRKFIFKLGDDALIESVLIPEEKRNTLCISTQVGCPLSCSFCKTGRMGYKRNLTLSEIVGQVKSILKIENDTLGRRITNLVFMGMGEPLLNYQNLRNALSILMDDSLYNFSKRKITVSTAGIVSNIIKLGSEIGVNLAISINSADEEKRTHIMPINKKYPLKLLRSTLIKYPIERRRRITFEYVMLKDFNDEISDAEKLCSFLQDIPAKVNLIPYNKAGETLFESSDEKKIEKFREYLLSKKIHTIIRRSRGADIGGACGQLGAYTSKFANKNKNRIPSSSLAKSG